MMDGDGMYEAIVLVVGNDGPVMGMEFEVC